MHLKEVDREENCQSARRRLLACAVRQTECQLVKIFLYLKDSNASKPFEMANNGVLDASKGTLGLIPGQRLD